MSANNRGAQDERPQSGDVVSTSIANHDGTAVLTVGGEIDMSTVATLEKAISQALAERPAALVVDLSAVDFLASAGLQTLVATHESVTQSGRFAVVADGPATSRPIQLTGLDEIFSLYSTLDEALAALQAE